jgi:hypothetical protein
MLNMPPNANVPESEHRKLMIAGQTGEINELRS